MGIGELYPRRLKCLHIIYTAVISIQEHWYCHTLN